MVFLVTPFLTKIINTAIGLKGYLEDKAKRYRKIRKLQTDVCMLFEGSMAAFLARKY